MMIKEAIKQLAQDIGISKIGFTTADEIAKRAGVEVNASIRVKSGMVYALSKASESGHTYLPKQILIEQSVKISGVEPKFVENGIMDLAYNQKVHLENKDGQILVYLMMYYICENGVCKEIIKLSKAKEEIEWLINRDYKIDSVVNFVGDR